MNRNTVLVGVLILFVAGGAWWFASKGEMASDQVPPPTISVPEPTPPAPIVQPSVERQPEGYQLYRNDEFGFEFQYLQGWIVSEERNTNPYNIFKVAVAPHVQYFQPFYVLVKKDANRITDQLRALGASTQEINVGRKQATRYEYDEEVHHITIIIPISDVLSLIIGNENNENVNEFEQILASFKFLDN